MAGAIVALSILVIILFLMVKGPSKSNKIGYGCGSNHGGRG